MTAPTAVRAVEDDGLAALLASPLPHPGLPIRVHAVPFRTAGDKAVVRLAVEVLGTSLALAERGGRFEDRVDLALLTVDDRGKASNGRSTRIDLRLTAEEASRVRATGVRWLSRLELPPGRHQLRVAGRAAHTGATGLATVDVEVPSFEAARPSLSGVVLTSLPSVLMVTRGDDWPGLGIPSPPSAARSFVAGDRITAAVEIYLPDAIPDAAISGRIEWADKSRSPLGTRKVVRGAAAAQPVTFEIDTSLLPPGRYVLHISATAGGTSMDRRVPFEVVPAAMR